jgi:hypothetical protein
MQDKNEAAETFFEAATSFQPNSLLAWTMLGGSISWLEQPTLMRQKLQAYSMTASVMKSELKWR